MIRVAALLCLCVASAFAAQPVHAQVPIPALNARVIDLTGTLSGETVNRLESTLAAFERQKGSQIAVLIVPTTQPEEIEQFGIRVADAWKLGRKGVDDGLILLVSKNDRGVRLEVGRGLEGAVPDAIANRIINDTITPHFKAGDYDGGVQAGVERIIAVVDGEPLPEPDKTWENSGAGLGNLLPVLLLVAVIGSGILRSLLGRLLGSLGTGGLVGTIAWALSHALSIGIGAGFLGFAFALVFGASRGWSAGGGGWGALGGFGGGGGGGGGGGFSGGGGGFSGGGASGSW